RLEPLAEAGSESRDEVADLLRRQHLVDSGFFDVEDLAPQRQDGLEPAVAARLRGTASGVALDQEQLGAGGVPVLAIPELAGQRAVLQQALALDQVARLASGLPGACRRQ